MEPDVKLTQAEGILGVSADELRRLAREGRLPGAYQLPTGHWRIRRDALDTMRGITRTPSDPLSGACL